MQGDSPFQNYNFVLVKKLIIDIWAIYEDIT